MITLLKELIKIRLQSGFYGRVSYSQEGEDLALDRLIGPKKNGFYVEVGCHHPFRFSNTFLFYGKNWSGVCIDPLPGTAALFKKLRPRDIVVEMGVSEKSSWLTYYMFNEPAFNTFDEKLAKERDGLKSCQLINRKEVQTDSLESILDGVNTPSEIDFFSIDVEGFDLIVLQSNNWDKYRPRFIIAEALNADLENLSKDALSIYLASHGYRPCIRTGLSVIYAAG
jgi:FkbM family methyltransferase